MDVPDQRTEAEVQRLLAVHRGELPVGPSPAGEAWFRAEVDRLSDGRDPGVERFAAALVSGLGE